MCRSRLKSFDFVDKICRTDNDFFLRPDEYNGENKLRACLFTVSVDGGFSLFFFSCLYSVFHGNIGEYTFVFGWCSTCVFYRSFPKK